MSSRRKAGPGARLRAWALPLVLLALLFQADAVVKSAVMGLVGMGPAEAAAMPDCGMGGMANIAMAGHVHHPGKGAGGAAACPYCAVAHHVAVLAFAAPAPSPSAVLFPGYRTVAARGPRGPPSVLPRARGPPFLA
jgi:hypothetical protein